MSNQGGTAQRAGRRRAAFVPAAPVPSPVHTWSAEAAALLAPPEEHREVTVQGGPGTGKTALLVDVAAARIAAGVDPGSVLVLTASRRAAADVRAQLTRATAGHGGVVREPLVRTVHSYAFAVLRLHAAAHDAPPPRLITAAEQDAVIRELLRGEVLDAADHPGRWPASLRPALGLVGFAGELRDLLLRAAERGLGPEDLLRAGRVHRRPEWVAAGRFWAGYEQSMLLRGAVGAAAPQAVAPALDAAELVVTALTAFATDPALLAGERARVRHLLVDDAQLLDPLQAELVEVLGHGADEVLVAGDPDQAVLGFRGADPEALLGSDRPRVLLRDGHRATPAVAAAVASVSARLPGAAPSRGPATVRSDGLPGRVVVHRLRSEAEEAAVVADALRRAHLLDDVPWSEMAVLVRSTARSLPVLRRAMVAAGVPVQVPATDLPLARQPAAAALLLVLRVVTDPASVTAEDALGLLASPVGRADPVALRRLRRGVRRLELAADGTRESAQLLRDALVEAAAPGAVVDPLVGLADREAEPLRRVQRVLVAATAALGQGVEHVLWAAWRAAEAQERWVAAAERGGPLGAQADRDLDAVVALFDAAARYVDRLPAASPAGFVDYLREQELPTDAGAPGRVGEAVSVLTAHSAAGRQWRVVAVAGVQEGLWPDLRVRGTLLGVEDLVELVRSGRLDARPGRGAEPAPVLSRTAPVLAEERRLFLLACSRAADALVVTAVGSTGGDTDLVPSRFLDDLAPTEVDGAGDAVPDPPPPRGLVLAELVAELRAVVGTGPGAGPAGSAASPAGPDDGRRARAARQLARLAEAGVPGADPAGWYGLATTGDDAPLWSPGDGPVRLSPSVVDTLATCPLRWVLSRHGGEDGSAVAAVAGTLVHSLVEALAAGTDPVEVERVLRQSWGAVDVGAPWFAERELERYRAMLDTFRTWLRSTRADLTEVGLEVAVDVVVPTQPVPEDADDSGEAAPAVPDARLVGRIDRLERDAQGRAVVVDVKTGKTAVSHDDAAEHAQLAAYQLALRLGGAVTGGPTRDDPDAPVVPVAAPGDTGGARLLYVARPDKHGSATERTQPAPDAEALQRWRAQVAGAAAATVGPRYLAVVNPGCERCPVRSSCPAHDEGRQVSG
ncbi:ATP-dependent DNA helicase [Rhodococcus aerolatus]